MQRLAFIFVFLFIAGISAAARASVPPDVTGMGTVDLLLRHAVSSSLIAGGVAVVGNRDGIVYISTTGTIDGTPGGAPLTGRTIFDLASLTKVIATTPAVMKLVEEEKIALGDPLYRWIPEFRLHGSDITVLHLLTHTSGLADFDLRPGQDITTSIRKASSMKGRTPAGTSFNYADINFILLAELVHRVSGMPLDRYCREQLFEPLGMQQTMFLPPAELSSGIAPTSGYGQGVVQDCNARRLGGIAGHAGLFSPAEDLARFARMILGGGILDGRRVLSEGTVNRMISPNACGGAIRGLGWDIRSGFSAPRGSFFSERSFGHTGYSGTSIWIDPLQDLFVIVLTNRTDYRRTRTFNQFRSDISTAAVAGLAQFPPEPGRLEPAAVMAALLQRATSPPEAAPAPVSREASRHASRHHAKKITKKVVRMARRKGYSRHRRA